MLLMQEHGKLRSYGLALRRGGLLEEMILHVLRQITPYPNDSLAQGARNLISRGWIDGWHLGDSLLGRTAAVCRQ